MTYDKYTTGVDITYFATWHQRSKGGDCWIALITGTSLVYGLERGFLPKRVEKKPKGYEGDFVPNVEIDVPLTEGAPYEWHSALVHEKGCSLFWIVRNGKLEDFKRAEALMMARSLSLAASKGEDAHESAN